MTTNHEAAIYLALDALQFADRISPEWDTERQLQHLREQIGMARRHLESATTKAPAEPRERTPNWLPTTDKPWFAWCPDNGFDFCATEAEALEAGAELIQGWLDDSWAEEVRDVFVGKAVHLSTQCDRVDRPETLDEDGLDDEGRYWDPDWDYMCNYRLERIDSKEDGQ